MDLLEQLSKPIKYLKDIRAEIQARNEKQIFFEEQFQKMVENGNIEKAVKLIHDEAKNLNARLNKDIGPEDLAKYCLESCEDTTEETESFKQAIEELKNQYSLSIEKEIEK